MAELIRIAMKADGEGQVEAQMPRDAALAFMGSILEVAGMCNGKAMIVDEQGQRTEWPARGCSGSKGSH